MATVAEQLAQWGGDPRECPNLTTYEGAAEYLNTSRRFVAGLTPSDLPRYKVGRSVRIKVGDLVRWLEDRRSPKRLAKVKLRGASR